MLNSAQTFNFKTETKTPDEDFIVYSEKDREKYINKLSKKQKELLQEFAETMEGSGATHSPKHESWLDAVKRFFE